MSESILSDQERKDFHNLQVRAAKLRLQHIEGEKEFIEAIGKEYTEAERIDIEKRRRGILHQLELEGAKIEAEYVEKYRSAVFRISRGGFGGGLEGGGVFGGGVFESCIICEKCVTATCLSCVACASCVTWVSI